VRPLTRGTTLRIPSELQLAVRVVTALSLAGFDAAVGRGAFFESDRRCFENDRPIKRTTTPPPGRVGAIASCWTTS